MEENFDQNWDFVSSNNLGNIFNIQYTIVKISVVTQAQGDMVKKLNGQISQIKASFQNLQKS